MRLRTDYAALASALRTVAPAVTARPALPVLGGVRLDAAAGRLRLTGTDLDTTITTTVPAEVSAAGAALVPFEALRQLFDAKRPAGTPAELHIDASDGNADGGHGALHVAAAAGRGRLRLLDLADFPALPPAGRPVADVPAATVQAWPAVTTAATADWARPVLCAVLLEAGPDQQITAAATDSYRLHVHTGHAAVHGQAALLVPATALATVSKTAKAARAEQVTITAAEPDGGGVAATPTATFTAGPTTLAVRLTEGEFPKFRNLIPAAEAGELVIRVTDACRAVAALKAAPGGRRRGARTGMRQVAAPTLVLGVAAGAAPTVTVSEPDVASWQGELDGAVVERAPCDTLAFNAAYLLDLLTAAQAAGARELTLTGHDQLKPVVLRTGNGFTGLLMPVRLPG